MVSRILLVLSAALVIVHGSESVNEPTGNAPTVTGNTPKASPVSQQSVPIFGTGPTKLAASSAEDASKIGSSSSLTSGGNAPKATSFSWDSASSSESKSEPLLASLKSKDSDLESSASNTDAARAALKSASQKKEASAEFASSEDEDDSEPSSKPGNQTEMVAGSSEESGSHGAQQISSGSGKPNATTPRPPGQSSNSSVVMSIPTKVPTLLPKQNSTNPIKNNSSSGGVQMQSPAQGSAVQAACSGFAILAVSVHLILSH